MKFKLYVIFTLTFLVTTFAHPMNPMRLGWMQMFGDDNIPHEEIEEILRKQNEENGKQEVNDFSDDIDKEFSALGDFGSMKVGGFGNLGGVNVDEVVNFNAGDLAGFGDSLAGMDFPGFGDLSKINFGDLQSVGFSNGAENVANSPDNGGFDVASFGLESFMHDISAQHPNAQIKFYTSKPIIFYEN
jgi:hypothetical protein